MDALVVDLTHGGVKIAVELEKLGQFDNIHAYDIYNTLKEDEKYRLHSHNIKLLDNESDIINYISNYINDLNNIDDLKINASKTTDDNCLLVINPIHSSFNICNIINNFKIIDNNNNNYNSIDSISPIDSIGSVNSINSINYINLNFIKEITHHKAVNLILNKWKKKINRISQANRENIPIIEVTGVKGKTSVVEMLKEILVNENPLVLSSLGANLYKNDKKIVLKKNISITPASMLETVKLAKKIANPDCIKSGENDKLCYSACIFESSLGVSGLGDVSVLTNIVENYPIAKDTSNAKNAKEQVFDCDIVSIEKETLEKYYSEKMDNGYNVNTFSFSDKNANLFVDEVKFDLNSTNVKLIYNDIKTISGKLINGCLDIDTFAPGKHHVLNVLAAVTAVLSCDIDENIIISGLANFMGIKGRTSLKIQEGQVIIEEINPGINTKAIESSIDMINNLNDYVIILGGKYGVTCEEIDENKVANFLDNFLYNILDISKDKMNKNDGDSYLDSKFNLILSDDLGKKIGKKMENTVKFIENPIEAQKLAIENNKNALFIYRSNYSQINKR